MRYTQNKMITFIFFISDVRNIDELQIENFNDIPDSEKNSIELIRCPSFRSINELYELVGINDSLPDDNKAKLFSIDNNFVEKLKLLEDEQIKDIGARWANQPSWENIEINPIDLAGFLLCFKEKTIDVWTVKHKVYVLIEN